MDFPFESPALVGPQHFSAVPSKSSVVLQFVFTQKIFIALCGFSASCFYLDNFPL